MELYDMCRIGNAAWESQEERYRELAADCERAIVRAFNIFTEDNAFLRYEDGRYVRRFNIAVYDAVSPVLADARVTDSAVAAKAEALREAFEELCNNDDEFQASLKTTTKTIGSTLGRISKWSRAVSDVLGEPLDIASVPRVIGGCPRH
jgi:flagellin-specific chaperone FliS